ncbi:recombinase family protein (plasmid) [Rhodococcus antarcticus]|uniref:Recombinase family protein n=1 Tax=Rhodococcus antarcticus TaxID=2987751 RepID=A0ABY6P5U8_9NOCA|nr:recombinase family protein [Rhodococcus antarcticus]UZJ27040.1 recombinase family protein [Rhodococcus antarcticus]
MGELLGYARVSTLEQDAALQHDALSAAGCFRSWTDTASGSLTDRPEFGSVMDALRPGDTLVVWRLDRLGRSLPHLIETVRGLAERGIGFRSLQEAIDTTTPGGRLVFHIFGSLAEFERDLIRERTMAGLAAARRRGRVGGRPTVMTAAKTKQAQRMVTAGTPLTEVADVLGVSRTTLYRHLKTQPAMTPAAAAAPTPVVAVPPVAAGAGRSSRACPSCGLEPSTRAEAAQLRADLAVRWLHPDPTTPGAVVEARHCRSCHPRGQVVDVECTRCGDGPIVTGVLAEDSTPGSVAYPARRWLVAAGWSTALELVCPEH